MTYCPFKFANPNHGPSDWHCEQASCQLWNQSLGQCGLVAIAYLKGIEVERRELHGQLQAEHEAESRMP